MTGKWSGLVARMRRIESAIQSRVEGRARAAEPLEIIHAVVRLVEQEVQPVGRGAVAFPYNHVRVWIAAPTVRDRARMEAACDGPPRLHDRIVERLTTLRCATTGLTSRVTFAPQGRDEWTDPEFHVEFARVAASEPPHAPARIDLTILEGTAEKPAYLLAGASLSIGRGLEVRDERGLLIRTNDVAFVDEADDINATVSRRHARITHDAERRVFRLHDEGATHGTSVVRDGRGLSVPRPRGLVLRSGDVIVLGRARARVLLPAS